MFLWGHKLMSFTLSEDKSFVKVKALVIETQETVEIHGDLLVAADGCLSSIRKTYLPDLKLRYSGYCAWRGVLDFSGDENLQTVTELKQEYPDLGKSLYFDLATQTHSVFYELRNKKLNWIWYVNQPEPQLKVYTLNPDIQTLLISTLLVVYLELFLLYEFHSEQLSYSKSKPRNDRSQMHEEAETIWISKLARLMKQTKDPFLNVIYDCDPLERIFWDNVVLVGDAAHPTTPHGLRSTNMSVLDAAVLGKCLEKCNLKNLNSGLEEYQRIRLPVVSEQVLYSRRLGRFKQGLDQDNGVWRFENALDGESSEYLEELKQRNMPFFACAPMSMSDNI